MHLRVNIGIIYFARMSILIERSAQRRSYRRLVHKWSGGGVEILRAIRLLFELSRKDLHLTFRVTIMLSIECTDALG